VGFFQKEPLAIAKKVDGWGKQHIDGGRDRHIGQQWRC
jgi:hypothetical protein